MRHTSLFSISVETVVLNDPSKRKSKYTRDIMSINLMELIEEIRSGLNLIVSQATRN